MSIFSDMNISQSFQHGPAMLALETSVMIAKNTLQISIKRSASSGLRGVLFGSLARRPIDCYGKRVSQRR